jgi:hypothetical protein
MIKLIADIVSLLNDSGFCEDTQILETSHFSSQQFAFKIRSTIFSTYFLQIRIYYNQGHYDYSYQIFGDEPICRWDNKEHFADIKTFPHHYHSIEGNVIDSPLKGLPIEDLKFLIEELKKLKQHLQK